MIPLHNKSSIAMKKFRNYFHRVITLFALQIFAYHWNPNRTCKPPTARNRLQCISIKLSLPTTQFLQMGIVVVAQLCLNQLHHSPQMHKSITLSIQQLPSNTSCYTLSNSVFGDSSKIFENQRHLYVGKCNIYIVNYIPIQDTHVLVIRSNCKGWYKHL